jgi:hypothetical protein
MVQYGASWLSQVPHGSVGTACRGRQGSVVCNMTQCRLQHGLAVCGLAQDGAARLSRVRRGSEECGVALHVEAGLSRRPF